MSLFFKAVIKNKELLVTVNVCTKPHAAFIKTAFDICEGRDLAALRRKYSQSVSRLDALFNDICFIIAYHSGIKKAFPQPFLCYAARIFKI